MAHEIPNNQALANGNNPVTGIVHKEEEQLTDGTSQHLLTILSNSRSNKFQSEAGNFQEENNNYNCVILLEFCAKFGLKFDFLKNQKAVDKKKLIDLMISHNQTSFFSRWFIFIGSAIEYGLVSEDGYVFNVKQLLSAWSQEAEPKVLIVFGSPHEDSANIRITNDNNDTEGIHTFERLLSRDYEEEVMAMSALYGTFKMQSLTDLDESVNYFFSSVPISLINNQRESILSIFINHMESSLLQHKTLSSTFQSIVSDYKQKLALPDSLLPIFQVTKDFNL